MAAGCLVHALAMMVLFAVNTHEALRSVTVIDPLTDQAVPAATAVRSAIRWIFLTIIVLLSLWIAFVQRSRVRSFSAASNVVTVLLIVSGLLHLASRLAVQGAPLHDYAAWGIVDVIVLTLLGAAIMRWSGMDLLIPAVTLLIVWWVCLLTPRGVTTSVVDRLVGVLMSPFAIAPALMLVEWRRRRRNEESERLLLGRQVEQIGGELSRARIVHDAMFPRPFSSGPVSLDYFYAPIQEIGGDYVHVFTCPTTSRVTLTMLDVAGHGLAAALSVNRLFGEIERIVAEFGEACPETIICLLNRYIHLTMARHGLFATGASVRLDPNTGTLSIVNAGHPPPFLRRGAGAVEPVTASTMMLGAIGPEEFDPCPHAIRLEPGDTIVLYTDGAFEVRNAEGHPFGMPRVRDLLSFDPPPRSWPRFLAAAIAEHHGGHADDDVLIASLRLNALRIGERATPGATAARE